MERHNTSNCYWNRWLYKNINTYWQRFKVIEKKRGAILQSKTTDNSLVSKELLTKVTIWIWMIHQQKILDKGATEEYKASDKGGKALNKHVEHHLEGCS